MDKSVEETHHQRNRNVILNRAKYFYENYKKSSREQARDKCRNLSEDKNKKREYGRNRYNNMSEKKTNQKAKKNIKKTTVIPKN